MGRRRITTIFSFIRTCWAGAAVALTLLGAMAVHAQTAPQSSQCDDKTYVHRNIIILGFSCPQSANVSIVPTQQGVEKIIQAIDTLHAQSPTSFAVIEQLKKAGPVIILYDPTYPPAGAHLITTQIASFWPTFAEEFDGNPDGKQFTVLIGRDGIKWPLLELSAVLVHELMGHGKQHLEDRLDTMRNLDVECEAWLYEETAYQDLKLDKMSREMVDFRQQLEGIHCSDFIRYMRKRTLDQVALWDVQNPDVAKLLSIFDGYIEEQRRRGMIRGAQAAIERQREEAIQKAAKKGDPEELYTIGLLYMSSLGPELDPKSAATWFSKAAKKGHAGAQYELATLLEKGEGVEKNLKLARKLYIMAAKQGNADAFYALGVIYETGSGVQKDAAKAKALFAKAAPKFDIRPYATFGILHRDGLGFPKNPKKAHELFLKAARLGHAWSQYALGQLYERGLGVKRDVKQAIAWYKRSAAQGFADAKQKLRRLGV